MNTIKRTLKRINLYLCGLVFVLIPIAGFPQPGGDPAADVNPFVGTGLSRLHDYGKTIPGASMPFGLLYWSPDTVDEVFYVYERPVTRGFSLTHISGPGCGLFGDVPIFPMMGAPEKSPVSTVNQASFSHDHEHAEPGYYEVTLDSGIKVRIAASVRSGIAEFHFPGGPARHTLLIDLGRNLSSTIRRTEIQIRNRTVTGSVSSGGLCGRPNRYQVYFALELAQTPEAYGTFDETGLAPGSPTASGPHAGGYLTFGSSIETVVLKAGISFVSTANAEANLRSEIGARDLDVVRSDGRAAWNSALGRARVSGGTEEDRKVFYTALYHSLLHPSVFNDVNGEYIGFDDKVHQAHGRTQYANFSGWDIYRCQVQLLAMLFPEVASDMAQSLVVDAEQGGGLPVWAAANDEVGAMVGDPSACILAGFYSFGARAFDVKAALAAMLRGASDPHVRSRQCLQRPDLEEYLRLGYVADHGRGGGGAASVTLEYQNADFAISRLAAALGDSASARALLARSGQWRKLFDAGTKFIRARGVDGSFLPGFTPGSEAGFVEGNSAQYTWMIPYDLAGVIAAVGGTEAAKERLDDYFSQYYDYSLKNGPYFAIGNEPSFGNPWIYNWTGHPWRTQEVVRKTLRDLFSSGPGGLPGNDDLGATSSWVVFAQLGMYPEIPGVGGVTLNSPSFPDITLRLGKRVLQITAKGAPSKLYVNDVRLDGDLVRNWWIDWEKLSTASNLRFSLSAAPNRHSGLQPPSFAPEKY
jgi:predicted alpha-1,2-mannosidase